MVERRHMTLDEIDLAAAFTGMVFRPCSRPERMARTFAARVHPDHPDRPMYLQISEAEARVLRNIAWRFRRQLPATLRPTERPT